MRSSKRGECDANSACLHYRRPASVDLTQNVLFRIFQFVSEDASPRAFCDGCAVTTLCAAACVCRAWRAAADDPRLWSRLILTSGPRPADRPWLTDSRLASLVARARGGLTELDLSGCVWPAVTLSGVAAALAPLAGLEAKTLVRLSIDGVVVATDDDEEEIDEDAVHNQLREFLTADGGVLGSANELFDAANCETHNLPPPSPAAAGDDFRYALCRGEGPPGEAGCGRLASVEVCKNCGVFLCGSCALLVPAEGGGFYTGGRSCDGCGCTRCTRLIEHGLALAKRPSGRAALGRAAAAAASTAQPQQPDATYAARRVSRPAIAPGSSPPWLSPAPSPPPCSASSPCGPRAAPAALAAAVGRPANR